jgi:oxalate decarboxylase/phosphoglucose isomerase-like protein (cupin superfamily)
MTPGAHVLLDDGEGELEKLLPQALDAIKVSALAAHQIFNTTDQPVKFIEYQKGACREDDII